MVLRFVSFMKKEAKKLYNGISYLCILFVFNTIMNFDHVSKVYIFGTIGISAFMMLFSMEGEKYYKSLEEAVAAAAPADNKKAAEEAEVAKKSN
mmetsp:Transcript_136545/g.193110  ORF Transcript_136545/g.193110 Transcript_136545/m.193110 type:complete len:94 (+) Transcript_136545:160-441(+)